ncbi:NAD-dependent 4,6-dehydratase LegB [Patescibacteria group bacterium]|nr:NAD-dependent 4,6-dehydratase LegB [Patescibacteria group bacterium]
MPKRILVTGAEGFIGSHLTEKLVRSGYKVRAFVLYNFMNSRGWLDCADPNIRKSLDIFFGDIRDPYGVKLAMKNCDCVLNLAALIGIPYSYQSPDMYVDTNVKGVLNILQAARELKTKKIIHTSTSEVYGTAQSIPITEEHPLQGQSPYSATKIAADQLALSFYRSFDIPVGIIRPFNTYGPRQSTRAIIPTIITQILSGRKSIELGSLTPTRDFNYIKDTVAGFIKALKTDKIIGEIVNLGGNYEISIKNTALLIAKIMDKKIKLKKQGKRLRPLKSEVKRLRASNKKARQILGWKPDYQGLSGFEKGLKETIAWFSEKKNLKHYDKTNKYTI